VKVRTFSEYRWAEGQYDRLPALANDLARRAIAVLVVRRELAAFAAKKDSNNSNRFFDRRRSNQTRTRCD
jgi:hypothetical protein